MRTTLGDVVATFEGIADRELVDEIWRLLMTGAVQWIWDPEVHTTAGLVLASDQRRAVVVVYDLGADFEVDAELLEALR